MTTILFIIDYIIDYMSLLCGPLSADGPRGEVGACLEQISCCLFFFLVHFTLPHDFGLNVPVPFLLHSFDLLVRQKGLSGDRLTYIHCAVCLLTHRMVIGTCYWLCCSGHDATLQCHCLYVWLGGTRSSQEEIASSATQVFDT